MIDLHCHLLPGIDDGAADLDMSIEMARIAAADGIRAIACTPHVRSGIYDNKAASIRRAVDRLREEFRRRSIGVELYSGGDVHVAPDLAERLGAGEIPTLAGSRYFLFEPAHHVLTPRLEILVNRLIFCGFVPILTHPERLSWVKSHYSVLIRLNEAGCLIQLTAGSITGEFGRKAAYFSERLLDEGRVDIIASDAHDTGNRTPVLSKARDRIAARFGDEAATAMVSSRPGAILLNRSLKPVGKTLWKPAAAGGRASLVRRFLKVSLS